MRFLTFFMILFLFSCSTTAPISTYRPRGSADNNWIISGTYNEMNGNLLIIIDGKKIISGNSSLWDGASQLSGTYKKYQITATCNFITNFNTLDGYQQQCLVFADGEIASTLRF